MMNGSDRSNASIGSNGLTGSNGSNGSVRSSGARRAAAASEQSLSPRGRRGRGHRGDSGQTAVEFMGLMPILGVVLLCLVQGGLIGYSYIQAGHAAASAARVAVSPEHGYNDIANQARNQLSGAWRRDVRVTVDGQTSFAGGDPRYSDPDAQVSVRVHTPAFPFVRSLFGDALVVTSTAQMRFEGR